MSKIFLIISLYKITHSLGINKYLQIKLFINKRDMIKISLIVQFLGLAKASLTFIHNFLNNFFI